MEYFKFTEYFVIYWSGKISETRLRMETYRDDTCIPEMEFHSAMIMNKKKNRIYCCCDKDNFQVSEMNYVSYENETDGKCGKWELTRILPRYPKDDKEMMLQLKLNQTDRFLLATTGNGFVIWDFGDSENDNKSISEEAIYLALPHGVRNISTKMMQSNSIMISSKINYAVAGVRKNLYVWCLETKNLMKILDAHFGRIMQLEALTIGNWNSVITSSIDRSVKIWNINNIFEQVHVIDRHELQIDNIR